jgi:hypothetical protein
VGASLTMERVVVEGLAGAGMVVGSTGMARLCGGRLLVDEARAFPPFNLAGVELQD